MRFLPGKMVQGMPLKEGGTLSYKTNGLLAFAVTIAAAIGLSFVIDPAWLFEQWAPLVTTANAVVLVLCVVLMVLSRPQGSADEKARNPLEAYVLGAALNPRTGNFDWKFFCESRPGMILWVLINMSAAYAQHRMHGAVSNSMWIVLALQALYVIDYFIFEEAILTTWDIQHESFGLVLCWGCLVWIPFTFSLQAVYLARHPVDLPVWACVGVVVLSCAGYYIFRSANLQKNEFRRNRTTIIFGKPAEFIQTKRGTKLLTSGWWGIARHANYLGDLMMGLAWCLATGVERIVPYFYIIYFTILLVHREWRDGQHCAEKYGDDWKAYVAKVRWRIIPGVY
jgi:Delta14-sterol reductase